MKKETRERESDSITILLVGCYNCCRQEKSEFININVYNKQNGKSKDTFLLCLEDDFPRSNVFLLDF